MDGLPISPIAASLAGVSLAAKQQDEQIARRVRREGVEHPIEPPTKVDAIGDAPTRERQRRNPRPKQQKPKDDGHIDLTA